ncbi:hypothetical protein Tco_0104378, partial [Tanacetum coccineum]
HKNDVHFLRANRQLTYPKKKLLQQLATVNIGPVRGFKVMKEVYGGFENIGVSVSECKNHRRDMNNIIGERDAQMDIEKLNSKKACSYDFTVEYEIDADGVLIGLFWADEDAKRNYH